MEKELTAVQKAERDFAEALQKISEEDLGKLENSISPFVDDVMFGLLLTNRDDLDSDEFLSWLNGEGISFGISCAG